jgi:hypothetical protein
MAESLDIATTKDAADVDLGLAYGNAMRRAADERPCGDTERDP